MHASFGMIFCVQCMEKTEFVNYEGQDVDRAECCVCGYCYGVATNEVTPTGSDPTNMTYTTTTKPVLSPEVVLKARKKLLEDMRERFASRGRPFDVVMRQQEQQQRGGRK